MTVVCLYTDDPMVYIYMYVCIVCLTGVPRDSQMIRTNLNLYKDYSQCNLNNPHNPNNQNNPWMYIVMINPDNPYNPDR